jgi:hypothetical protein
MEVAICIKSLSLKNGFEIIEGNEYSFILNECSCDFNGDYIEAKIYDIKNRWVYMNIDLHAGYMFRDYFMTKAQWREKQINSVLKN